MLFYGSNLRSGELDGVLDYYVLVDSLRGWYGKRLPAAANRLLPPNILYLEPVIDGRKLRAKVAVLRKDQFQRGMRRGGLDTTMWARYSQPAALAWCRDEAARADVVASVGEAVVSAASWAARLGPESGPAGDYWQALYKRTYSAELRVEKASRTDSLMAFAGDRYAALLPIAWDARTRAEGGQRWFHLSPGEKMDRQDPLHWTGRSAPRPASLRACRSRRSASAVPWPR
mgnify:CR=1 FL=1